MSMPVTRSDAEQRIEMIRFSYELLTNEESRGAVTDGLLANIGELLNEVDYWRTECLRIQSTQDISGIKMNHNNQIENAFINVESITYECPHCNVGYEDEDYTGISWISIGNTTNKQGHTVDIGYIHCSECGKDSPLYAGKDVAELNWCIEILH